RPRSALVAALDAALGAGPEARPADLAPAEIGRRTAATLGAHKGLLVFIDQLEELLLVSEPSEAQDIEAALPGPGEAGPGVRLLASLRADFLTRFAILPVLGEELARHLYFLKPLEREGLRDVIVGPAEATGLGFESSAMVDELADSAARSGGG